MQNRAEDQDDQKAVVARLVMEDEAAQPAAGKAAGQRQQLQHDFGHARSIPFRLFLVEAIPEEGDGAERDEPDDVERQVLLARREVSDETYTEHQDDGDKTESLFGVASSRVGHSLT